MSRERRAAILRSASAQGIGRSTPMSPWAPTAASPKRASRLKSASGTSGLRARATTTRCVMPGAIDAANLGTQRATNYFIARGAGFVGYLAAQSMSASRPGRSSYLRRSHHCVSGAERRCRAALPGEQRLTGVELTDTNLRLGYSAGGYLDFATGRSGSYDVRFLSGGANGSDGGGDLYIYARKLVSLRLPPDERRIAAARRASLRWSHGVCRNGLDQHVRSQAQDIPH